MKSCHRHWSLVGGLLLVLGACSEGAQWREMRPEGLSLVVAMPCRPDRSMRKVTLAGERVDMTLLVCRNNDATFAVGSATMTDPRSVRAALDELALSARANIRGRVIASDQARVPGMTPNESAALQTIFGQSPEGNSIEMRIEVFAYGLRVFQVTSFGSGQQASAATGLFDSLRVVP